MSTHVGSVLPPALFARLSVEQALAHAACAMVVVTLDDHGWPHPAMVSSLELVARDPGTIRVALPASSRTVRHVSRDRRLTLVVADAQAVHYIKTTATLLPAALIALPGCALIDAVVEHVLEDAPHAGEAARVVSGVTIARPPIDETRARALLAELTR
jgi:flavin reductase (DIM6/NTAB) family NADH-FMN oxidoreductase RutF